MDESRLSRYVTPATFHLGSLLLGLWSDDPHRFERLADEDFLHLAAAAGASLFPIGFIIISVSTVVLSGLFAVTRHPYEAALNDDAWNRVWTLLKFRDPVPKRSKMNRRNAAQTFDHEFLPDRTHAGAARLWSAFNISAHSVVAVLLSFPIGMCLFDIACTPRWSWSVITVCAVLTCSAVLTWRRHKAFLELQTRRDWGAKEHDDSSPKS